MTRSRRQQFLWLPIVPLFQCLKKPMYAGYKKRLDPDQGGDEGGVWDPSYWESLPRRRMGTDQRAELGLPADAGVVWGVQSGWYALLPRFEYRPLKRLPTLTVFWDPEGKRPIGRGFDSMKVAEILEGSGFPSWHTASAVAAAEEAPGQYFMPNTLFRVRTESFVNAFKCAELRFTGRYITKEGGEIHLSSNGLVLPTSYVRIDDGRIFQYKMTNDASKELRTDLLPPKAEAQLCEHMAACVSVGGDHGIGTLSAGRARGAGAGVEPVDPRVYAAFVEGGMGAGLVALSRIRAESAESRFYGLHAACKWYLNLAWNSREGKPGYAEFEAACVMAYDGPESEATMQFAKAMREEHRYYERVRENHEIG